MTALATVTRRRLQVALANSTAADQVADAIELTSGTGRIVNVSASATALP